MVTKNICAPMIGRYDYSSCYNAANESDMHHIGDVIDKAKLNPGARIKADKGYASSDNRQALAQKGFKDNIMHKAAKTNPSLHGR
jgi:IS5 family transposase